ncbi:MAG: methylisocitrate lyase [Pirellulaceae bacterium]
MHQANSAGARLRAAVEHERPLQVVGVINAYAARLAQAAGFRALYISGAGVAASSCGIPDLGITTREDVLADVRRVVEITDLPLLVDIDTGWGGTFQLARTIRAMIRAGAAGVHIEDQVPAKRCGHRTGKVVVPAEEMVDRVRVAVNARTDADFVVMARTDALAVEGLAAAVERGQRYVEAGADMLFPEGVHTLAQYRQFVEAVSVPVLANITEFGVTPLFTVEELRGVGVRLVLYPLSAFRAMSAAALKVYQTVRTDGTQQSVLGMMQTRDELYGYLGYHACEQELDQLLARERK